ncbi:MULTISPECIES: tRNA uridine-5-carboxymethylaminomethyl(34) synthesis enzyme MnmG [unclassified Sphingomonas]|uniref:tRNA uridine-5-carboxymethylaminomethyl(34) synthesis enzyme MnmG n=1 Tax=unclassified Sphingomonas TaxID=196159 RepID=UPI00215071B9|nr:MULTISPECIES: tRNA uridine-5-carboxymethylaminomethyl(34) synthesis enzyme MnmG [unclassified Sphingomonas]MCR5870418.1 tRNA uridine-5-carboxymethylaminomethyl(34) synthesis enzyme MnmG [Sphingomonas sp. J344]UUY01236.1 tRNA uridine-5-carboxymethylaminomethyl(34) synthesis enzyme MnmG [Sphingomonas sp. J315]
MHTYDVIVIGGGHAGTEAAAAAARCGARTALVTFDPAMIGAMSCNPAIGGLGKGHLVREVDALDGLIARAADAAAIHYRLLNRSKGPAVQGPRVQADRIRYSAAIQTMLAAQQGLGIVAGEAVALLLEGGRIAGIRLADDTKLHAHAVILASGTFLGGRIFRGEERETGGRVGERAATALGIQLRDCGLPITRLKTGTPPRLDGRTIDWAALEEQPSDADDWRMSPMTRGPRLPQLACAITRTTLETHAIIRTGLDRSPLFSGAIEAGGPRYCPSIEDKIFRFGDRDGHQVFLEPEGLATHLVYPNGLSTSLPTDIQAAMIASMRGLEHARIVTPGYAVEYDHVDPRSLTHQLECRDLPGLYCAGQINGTTGYEEAAAQGLVAGINAAAAALGRAPTLFPRQISYIGVMIDDLTLQGVTEPYRMLTARAEHRLYLRADNAQTRLAALGDAAGCLGPERQAFISARAAARQALDQRFSHSITAHAMGQAGSLVAQDGARRTAFEWLRFPAVTLDHLGIDTADSDPAVLGELIEDARYAPYLERQAAEAAAMIRADGTRIPDSLDYCAVPGLSNEMVERLGAARPATLGDAARVRGITPAALTAILLHVKRAA